MKKTKEECLLMNGIMSYDLGKNEARIMKAMDDWAEDVVKNLSSNPVLADRLPNAEDVKRWFQLLVGKSEIEMQKDIEATLR